MAPTDAVLSTGDPLLAAVFICSGSHSGWLGGRNDQLSRPWCSGEQLWIDGAPEEHYQGLWGFDSAKFNSPVEPFIPILASFTLILALGWLSSKSWIGSSKEPSIRAISVVS